MKIWQKALTVCVFALFVVLRGSALLLSFRELPINLSEEQKSSELVAAYRAYVKTVDKINTSNCSTVDFHKGRVVIHNAIVALTGYHTERDSVGAMYRSLVDIYSERDPRYKTLSTTPIYQPLAGVPPQKGIIDGYDCRKAVKFFCLVFPINFLPFIMPLIFIKRWYYRRPWQISLGDFVVIILCHLTGTFAHLVYSPNNFLQKRIDSQLQIWKRKIGAHGWRLALAYLVAIIVSLATLIRPAKSQTQMVVETKIVSVVPAAVTIDQQEKSDEQQVFFSEKAVGVLRRFFEEVMRGIEIIVSNFFSLLITQIFPLPLEFVWGLWARPPDEIRFWTTRALGSRAPADFVLVSSLKTWTKKITGVYHENQNVFYARPSSGFFCHR